MVYLCWKNLLFNGTFTPKKKKKKTHLVFWVFKNILLSHFYIICLSMDDVFVNKKVAKVMIQTSIFKDEIQLNSKIHVPLL